MLMVVYKMALMRAELHLMEGNLAEAKIALNDVDALSQSSLPKAEHVAAHLHAMHLAACGKPEEALRILARLEGADRDEGSVRRLIGVYVTKALILDKQSKATQARQVFESALKLAAPEGYKTAFMPTHARNTRHLLRAARSAAPDFVDSVLAASPPASERLSELPDPLSEQEIKVLGLIVAGKSNQEIAEELVISVGTAKWHVHNVLQKLGAKNRSQAVAAAAELGIM
jgi:LuxR family maltose regulon positive regulatory protein